MNDIEMDAFETLLRLARHYALLLNMYDGGKRALPQSVDKWIKRVKEMELIENERSE